MVTKITKSLLVILITLSVSILMTSSESFADKGYNSILYTNDIHGELDILSRLNKDKNTLWVDGGDLIQGSDLALLSQGEAIIDIVNYLGLDILIPGNHEFDYGVDRLLELEERFNGEFIVANVYLKETNERLFKPYTARKINGKDVLIIGLTTEEINTKIYRPMVESIIVTPPKEELLKILKEVDIDYDELLVVAHIGKEITYDWTCNISNLTLLLDSHDHKMHTSDKYVNNGSHGEYVTFIYLDNKTHTTFKTQDIFFGTNSELNNIIETLKNKHIPVILPTEKTLNLTRRINLDIFSDNYGFDWRVIYLLNRNKYGLSQKYQFIGSEDNDFILTIP